MKGTNMPEKQTTSTEPLSIKERVVITACVVGFVGSVIALSYLSAKAGATAALEDTSIQIKIFAPDGKEIPKL